MDPAAAARLPCPPLPKTVEYSSRGYDSTLQGVGLGTGRSLVTSEITIPSAPTVGSRCYLIQLAHAHVPLGQIGIVRSLRQQVQIGPVPPPNTAPLLLPVTTPYWRPVDGSILWGLRTYPDTVDRLRINPTFPPPPSYLPGLYGSDCGVLYDPEHDPLTDYVPPGGTDLDGTRGIDGDVARFADIRFPHQVGALSTMGVMIRGPRHIAFLASIRQTDPETRAPYPVLQSYASLAPEDRFMIDVPGTIYRKISASIVLDLYPACRCGLSEGAP